MNEKNNINTLFSRLEDLNVLDSNFSKNIQSTYSDFFKYDRASVSTDPYELMLDDDHNGIKDGRFFLNYKGAHFECFFKNGANKDQIIVIFGGARFGNVMPQFRRWSWYPFIDGHILCIEDPMYFQFSDLRLGWFYGNKNEDYAIYAAEIIRKIACKLGITSDSGITMYASSGGGLPQFVQVHLLMDVM